MAIALLCAGVVAAGFLLGHSRSGTRSPADHTAVVGPFSFDYPDDEWRVGGAKTTLQSAVGLDGQRQASGGSFLAGLASAVDARSLLPRGARHGKGELVGLGRYEALRYRSPHHATYTIPVGRGALLVLCSGKSAALRRCESIATTIVLHGVQAGRIGPDPVFAAAVGTAVAHLDAVRVAERRALRAATSPDARAGHAEVLASAYATASAQLDSIPAGPHEQGALKRLERAFGLARDGYVLLGAAFRARDHGGYVGAVKKIRAAEAQANAAIRALAKLGYPLRR